MADYLITGKKGNGKGIYAVGVIRDALVAGKKVVTNMDIKLEAFGNPYSKKTIIRIPDTPTREDLDVIGRGQSGVVEEDNGVLVIDEITKGLSSRAWSDKGRAAFLDWLVHSRKLGWDCYLSCQGPEQIDKQVRTALVEYWIVVRRTDKWPIPILSPLVKMLTGYKLTFPKMHIGTIRHGFDRDSLVVERKYYKGPPLYGCYDTQQVFLDRDHPKACGVHTVLSPWHTTGRYMPPKLSLWGRVFPLLAFPFAVVAWLLTRLSPRFHALYASGRY